MDPWLPPFILLLLLLSVFLSLALKHVLLSNDKRSLQLPPGPSLNPIVATINYFSKSVFDIETVLRDLRAKYGSIFTLRLVSKPSIFIADHALAHHALVQRGAIFADRLPPNEFNRVISRDQHSVSSAHYGPLWRVLRRNLTSEILHPKRIKHFAGAREWALGALLDKLKEQAKSSSGVATSVMESFQHSMFCLIFVMCFGERLDEKEMREIQTLQATLSRSFVKFNVLTSLPKIVSKVLFWRRWKLLLEIRRRQEEISIPLIRARGEGGRSGPVYCYVDSLLQLSIPEGGGRRLKEGEMVGLVSELLNGGTDATAAALEWTMAELVVHGEIQKKLSEEIDRVIPMDEEIKEEDLRKMTYLKAVVLEGLRRHPPAHFLPPHAAMEDAEIAGYVVPKNASVNVMVAEMGWDEMVWDEPMEYKPERFLKGGEGEGVDITGSREIKMMPFGVGRRICPGLALAMLHMEYFVANLVREFEWKSVEGEEVDLSEKLEVAVVMKNHLRARITPRRAIRTINKEN